MKTLLNYYAPPMLSPAPLVAQLSTLIQTSLMLPKLPGTNLPTFDPFPNFIKQSAHGMKITRWRSCMHHTQNSFCGVSAALSHCGLPTMPLWTSRPTRTELRGRGSYVHSPSTYGALIKCRFRQMSEKLLICQKMRKINFAII